MTQPTSFTLDSGFVLIYWASGISGWIGSVGDDKSWEKIIRAGSLRELITKACTINVPSGRKRVHLASEMTP